MIPGIDATAGAVIVAESIEADALRDAPADALFSLPFDDRCDWALAVLAQILFDVVREVAGSTRPIPDHLRTLRTRAWTALERALDSPNASPLLWYQDMYFDVAQEYRVQGDPRASTIMKRGLAHCLHFNEGDNAEPFLRDIAETFLWLGDFNSALPLYTALIRNEPDNIWHNNSIALTFAHTGLPKLGIQATKRGLRLISATGDLERLNDQFRDTLARLEACEHTDRTPEIDLSVLTDFCDSLTLGFEAGRDWPYPALALESVPDIILVSVKEPAEMPVLPSPSMRRSSASPERSGAPSLSLRGKTVLPTRQRERLAQSWEEMNHDGVEAAGNMNIAT